MIRVSHRKARGKHSARYLFRCGCCKERLEVYYGLGEFIEINGVIGTIDEWKELLLPLLTKEK